MRLHTTCSSESLSQAAHFERVAGAICGRHDGRPAHFTELSRPAIVRLMTMSIYTGDPPMCGRFHQALSVSLV